MSSTEETAVGTTSGGASRRKRVWRRIGLGVGVLVAVLILLVGTLYVYPLGSDRLKNAEPKTLSFAEASAEGAAVVQQDTANNQVLPECRTLLRVHPQKTAKAVLMLHGYTSCPKDYVELAQLFYDRGYNVYAPRESHHGLTDVGESSKVGTDGLADYADTSMNIVAGLGSEVGVIGLSGGGVLATWLAEYRPDVVSHVLFLSPFYQPAASQAPSFALRPLTVLYGYHVLPDRKVGSTNFTLSGLAQYLRITRNFRDDPTNAKLRSVAVVTSAKDPNIDLDKAFAVPTRLAEANDLKVTTHEFPPEANLPHNIVSPANLGARAGEIENLYFELYEG
jgi:alpha-beta hydrolase superfamily lysophospholipase